MTDGDAGGTRAAERERDGTTRAPEKTAATRRISPSDKGRSRSRSRRVLAGAAGLILLAGGVTVAIALGGGGDGEGADPTADSSMVGTTDSKVNPPREKPGPDTLSRSQLITKADAICAESQDRYTEVRDLESEYAADVPYAEALARFARKRTRGLRALVPPRALARPYGEYVEAQERVYDTDVDALNAARKDDVAGVEAARNQRDAEDELREDLARKIGFDVCSTPQS